MASFLSTAASYLGRTTLSTNYTIDPSVTPVYCGNWKVLRAVRNTGSSSPATHSRTGDNGSVTQGSSAKDATADLGAGKGVVSIWEAKLEARGGARQIVVDMLKKEVGRSKALRTSGSCSDLVTLSLARKGILLDKAATPLHPVRGGTSRRDS